MTKAHVLPGVWQLTDSMGVCMTLLVGDERALLVDTGYGLEDVAGAVRSLTDKPLTVILTHGHHDHALGARWFDEVLLFEEDLAVYARYTREAQRRTVQEQAHARGLCVPEDFLTAPMARPLPLAEGTVELGGLSAVIRRVPGHTPGSAVIEVPQRSLLLTGDDWNPCTWVFFEECLPVTAYRENMRRVLSLPFANVLCSHRPELFDRTLIDAFFAGLTDEALASAPAVEMGRPFATCQLSLPYGQTLVFDHEKYEKYERK